MDADSRVALEPDGVDPLDLSSLIIEDSAGRMILLGNFLDATSIAGELFKSKMPVSPGAAAPNAAGLAQMQTRQRNGARQTKFRLFATGTAPNATLTLRINGVEYGTVQSDGDGKVNLRDLPAGVDADSILQLELDDPDGTNALTVTF